MLQEKKIQTVWGKRWALIGRKPDGSFIGCFKAHPDVKVKGASINELKKALYDLSKLYQWMALRKKLKDEIERKQQTLHDGRMP